VGGALPTRVIKCPSCEHPEYNEKKGTVSTKTELLKFTVSIGLFMREHFMNTLVDYTYHYTLVKLLGKGPGSCGEMRMKQFLDSKKDGSCITEIRDFAERVDIVMADAIQADHFGRKRNLSIEGCSLKYFDAKKQDHCKDDPVLWSALKHEHEYHGHFSDKSKQDAAMVFAHKHSMLNKLQAQGVLSMVEGEGPKKARTIVTRLKNTDGCAKQYRSGTSLYLMSQLVQRFPTIRIDAMIGAPGHGKDEVDGLNAVEKAHIQDQCVVVITPGINDTKRSMMAHTRTVNVTGTDTNDGTEGTNVSIAAECIKICSHLDWVHRVISLGKYQKREANRKITRRVYHLQKEDEVEFQKAKLLVFLPVYLLRAAVALAWAAHCTKGLVLTTTLLPTVTYGTAR
jgi:hypothetical protein